jgi:protein-tyrosine phosphatase
MLPLADTHVHLLAGLDDGPKTPADALAMCRQMAAEGVRHATALAHQNPRYPANTPDRLRAAAAELSAALKAQNIPLTVFPTAEVMADPDLADAWRRGDYLSVADRGQYLLVEMPDHRFVDLRPVVKRLRGLGVRPILAHPEQHPELLHEPGAIEELIGLGCLVQVSADSLTDPPGRSDAAALKDWVKRGVAHLLGSDGHSPTHRPPRLAAAYQVIARWAGPAAADRIGSIFGSAVLHGLPLRVPPPLPRPRKWWAFLTG